MNGQGGDLGNLGGGYGILGVGPGNRGEGSGNRGRGTGNHGRGHGNHWGRRHADARNRNQQFLRNRDPNANSSQNATSVEAGENQSRNTTENQTQRNRDGPVFGFKRLHGFLETSPDDVIMAVDRNVKEWEKLLCSEDLCKPNSDDFLVLVIHVLGEKICAEDCNVPIQQTSVVTNSLNESYIKKLKFKMNKICMGSDIEIPQKRRNYSANPLQVDTSGARILQNIHAFLNCVTKKMPITALDLLQTLIPIAIGAATALDDGDPVKQVELVADFEKLRKLFKTLSEKKRNEEVVQERRKRFGFTKEEDEEMHEMSAPENFREVPITPTIDEILSIEEPFLRTNKKSGAYNNADHYLDTQYRLLREDFVRPLKNGIQDFIKNRHDYLIGKKRMPLGTVRIYKDVTIIRAELIKDSFIYNIQLSENNYKKIKWNKSKRLLVGSLLVFTSDMFKNASFATVAIREDKKIEKGILGIKWEGIQPVWDRRQSFLMVECEVYFEAYRHTLQTLKSIELDEFPMYKFIVESSSEVEAPRYLRNAENLLKLTSRYGEENYFNPLVDNQWLSATDLGLDEKQYEAFKAALTKEFAIIQGPPGTGKTFLGLKVTEVLLNNMELWKTAGAGPILVVCYTNHALDQFMEGILQVFQKNNLTPSMVRVGGRCQSEILETFSLARQRRLPQHSRLGGNYYASKSAAFRELKILQNDRAELMTELMGLNDLKGIIDFEGLQVWRTLQTEYPEVMWRSFQNLNWFGLADVLFSINFSADKMINDWFNRRPVSGRANPNHAAVIPAPAQRGNDPAIDEASDEEDYDIDELMENRMIEDIYAEAETTAPKNIGQHLEYLPEFSINYIRKLKSEIQASRANIEKTEKQFNIRRVKLQECDQKLQIVNNKQEFIEKLFGSYSEGSIEVNNVDPIVVQAKTAVNFNPYALSLRDKWSLFFHVIERAKALTVQSINQAEAELIEAEKTFQELLKLGDGNLLLNTKVVGMTTTGAAKYNDLLKIMRSRIVIVEEAAEVLESHIVTCITKHCQHLILIGDHRQLRPSTAVYNLAKHYHLDLSLFERMINNNLNWYQLKMQHRMRPEIANLVVGTIYEELENHDSVTMYPPVSGVRKNLFFIAHQEKEKSESDSTSKSNEHEAKFLARLCRYLVLQGYGTDRITVLTTYVGQMFLLKKEIGQFPTCKGVRITCVDNFQGEENDIILLSLVRSNEEQKIGFLNIDNRICVAISRAKHGLYICGNMSILSSKSKTWLQIKNKLEERGEIGDQIDFECQNHGTITSIGCLADFNKVAEGGCLIPCDTLLNCGHKCRLVCHIMDREHTEYKCLLKCEKKCGNNHQCESKCYQKCKPCTVSMEKTLPCSHKKILACHVLETSVPCMEAVEKTLSCGHKEMMACFKNPTEVQCRVKMIKTLKCEHQKELECHQDVDLITCRVNVKKTLPCGHEDEVNCFLDPNVIRCQKNIEKVFEDCQHKMELKCCDKDKPRDCKSKCTTRLTCGHACIKFCHVREDPNHLSYTCKKRCGRKCPAGLHECKVNHPCHTACKPCLKMVTKPLPCGHRIDLQCSYDASEHNCIQPCDSILSLCKHKCQNLCFQPCGPCMVEVKQRSVDCGHYQDVPCSEYASKRRCEERVKPILPSACIHDTLVPCRVADTVQPKEAVQYCQFPCGELFDKKVGGCGHRCKGTCSECEQGGIHLKCQQDCKRTLVCGHICGFPCGNCPPCEQPCNWKCEHSECKRNCGEPCNDCTEKCTYGCVHRRCSKLCGELCDIGPCEEPCPKKIKCGHPCVGFCGDPCPPLCRDCDFTELTEMLFGYEEEVDARFVYLEDCKHTIESQGMDHWMKEDEELGEIGAKCCPKCKTLVRSTKRYGNNIKKQLKNVMQVKVKIFGNQKAVKEKLTAWVAKLHWDEPDRAWGRLLPVLRDYLIEKLADIVPHGAGANDQKGRIVPKKIGESSMESVDLIARYGEDAINIFRQSADDIKPDMYQDLRRRYKELFDKLMKRKIPLTNMEVRDFDLEFERLHDLQQLYLRRSSPRFTDGHVAANLIYDKALRKLLSMGKYSKKIKDDIHKSFKELEELLKTGLGISDRERRDILNAINMSAGRWFKCPNGHVYLITECGGAMEESKCNECGAVIGGGSHRLRSDNAIATEMDGAIAPLYPNMLG